MLTNKPYFNFVIGAFSFVMTQKLNNAILVPNFALDKIFFSPRTSARLIDTSPSSVFVAFICIPYKLLRLIYATKEYIH